MPEVTLPEREGWRCNRCNHEWPKRKTPDGKTITPTLCAKCHNPYWNKMRLE